MLRPLLRFIERLLAPLPGWMFVLAGMSLLGMAILVPAWVESRHMHYQLDLMRAQTKAITEEHQRFTQFNEALASDDPIVLERMAFYYLRLQPEGVTSLNPDAPARPALDLRPARMPRSNREGIMPVLASRPSAVRTPSVEEMLEQPVPDPGVNYPPYLPVNTRLVRITTTWLRGPLIAAAILAVLAGLYMPTPEAPAYDESPIERAEIPERPQAPDRQKASPVPAPEAEAEAGVDVLSTSAGEDLAADEHEDVIAGEIDEDAPEVTPEGAPENSPEDAPFDPVVATTSQTDDVAANPAGGTAPVVS